jgi:hypothetical protein
MKRFLTAALVLGVFSTFGLVGCGEQSKVEEKQTVSTPGGETTTTKTEKVETSGSNPPATTGETPPPAK